MFPCRIAAFLLCALSLLATDALAFTGRVVDAAGKPVAGARIYVVGRTGEAVTDANGRFDWQPDPPPPFEVLVVQDGGAFSKPVLVRSLTPGTTVELVITSVIDEAITVSGAAPYVRATPAAGTTALNALDISRRQPSNVIQALEGVAGVNQVSEGQAAVPAIRGLSAGRTLILIDGARVTSERRVGPSATFLDPAMLDSIEVVRGSGGVAYGSDAFGGVISLRTRQVAAGAPLAFRFDGMVGGAGVPEQRGSLEVSSGLGSGSVLFAAHKREADHWDSPQGEVFNSGYKDSGFLAKVAQNVGGGTLSAGWQSDFGRDIERPRNNSRTVRFFYPTEDSHRFTAGYDKAGVAGFRRVAVTGFLGSYAQVTDQDRFATATTGRSIERADVSAKDFGVRAFGEKLIGRSRMEVGVDVNGRFGLHAFDDLIQYDLADSVVSTRPNVSVDSAHRNDTGVYATIDTRILPLLSLGTGIRGDYVTSANSGGYFGDRSTSNGAFSGFAALTAGTTRGLSATLQVARGFRDPTVSDRYYRGPTGRGFITGNPDLDPETSLQMDLAVRYAAPRVRLGAFYYRYRINDLVERYQTTTDFFFFRNRGRARIDGFEVEAQTDLGAGMTLDIATQVGRGKALDDGNYLDGVSPYTLSAMLRRQFGARAFGQVRVGYFADDDRNGPTEIKVPGYTMLDLGAGYRLAAPLELRVSARNLLNEEYFASQDTRTVLAPGRSVALTASVKF